MKLCFPSLGLASLLALAACGTPGAPQPPSLELPRTVGDFSAARKADRVTLAWTEPRQNTDGTPIKRPLATRICRAANQLAALECSQAGELPAPAQPPAASQRQTYTDVLPAQLQQNPSGFASYAVEVVNRRGRGAGLSNQVTVPLAPTLPPPSDLHAQLTPDTVVLSWTAAAAGGEPGPGVSHFYRLYRQTEGAPAATVVGEVPLSATPQAMLEDRNFEWERTYAYRITIVTAVTVLGKPAQIEGEDSPPVTVAAHDVFPPASPAGLQAVASGVGQPPFIDLTWAPDTESDLAGYNVYRREEGAAAAARVNSAPVSTSSYRDSAVVPGHRYFYSVTAVDLRGNESAHSQEASETVPP